MGRDQPETGLKLSGTLFQFTRPHGARPVGKGRVFAIYAFQFTRPHGARPQASYRLNMAKNFNSRARMGRDKKIIKSL